VNRGRIENQGGSQAGPLSGNNRFEGEKPFVWSKQGETEGEGFREMVVAPGRVTVCCKWCGMKLGVAPKDDCRGAKKGGRSAGRGLLCDRRQEFSVIHRPPNVAPRARHTGPRGSVTLPTTAGTPNAPQACLDSGMKVRKLGTRQASDCTGLLVMTACFAIGRDELHVP